MNCILYKLMSKKKAFSNDIALHEWLVSPNYRGLGDIKIEIQVRTILMHAWAEIEHKLAYKNKAQIPESVTRNLALISAAF